MKESVSQFIQGSRLILPTGRTFQGSSQGSFIRHILNYTEYNQQ